MSTHTNLTLILLQQHIFHASPPLCLVQYHCPPWTSRTQTSGAPSSIVPDYNHFDPLSPSDSSTDALALASTLPAPYTPDMYGNPADLSSEFQHPLARGYGNGNGNGYGVAGRPVLSAVEAAAAGLSTVDAGLGFQHPNAAGLVGRGAGYDHMGRPSLWDYANIPSVYKGKSQLLHPSMQVPLRPVTHYERVTLPNGLHMNVPHDLSQPQFGGGISAYPGAVLAGQPFHPALSQGGYLPHPLSAVANPEGPGADHRSQMYWRAQQRVHEEQSRAQHAMDEATQDVKVKQGRLDDFKMQSDEIQAEMEHAVQGIHKERQYIADMSRRVAALDVDKHRLDLRSKLDGLMGQYNRAEEHSNELQDARTKAGAVKRDLQGEIHATRENLRSSMSTISKLINDKGPDAEAKEDERKAEKAEKMADDLSQQARDLQAKADKATVAASRQFAANAEAGALGNDLEVIGGSGASGSAKSGSGSGSDSGSGSSSR